MFPVDTRINLIFSFNFGLPLFSKIRCEIVFLGLIEFQVLEYSVRTRKYLIKMFDLAPTFTSQPFSGTSVCLYNCAVCIHLCIYVGMLVSYTTLSC
jgi:hypothetical protein